MEKSLSAPTEKSAKAPKKNLGFFDYLIMDIKHFFCFLKKDSDYKLAYKILGNDFIPPEEIMRSRKRKGIIYTDEQLMQFKKTVPTREILRWCRNNNFMLVAGPSRPMSLLEIRAIRNSHVFPKKRGWYANHRFSQEDKVETKWYMIRKEPVPGSTYKSLKRQLALLSDVETVPNIAELTWAITAYKAVRDICLFGETYARTSSVDSDGDHVSAGYFMNENLFIGSHWDSPDNNGLFTLSSARK